MSKIDQKFKNAVDRIDSEHSKLTLRTLIDNAQNVDELEYVQQHIRLLMQEPPDIDGTPEEQWIYKVLTGELEYCGKRSQTLQTLQTLQMGV